MYADSAASAAGAFRTPAPLADSAPAGRLLTAVLVTGLVLVTLAVSSAPLFDLDRHAVPKETVLHATALAGLSVLLVRRRVALPFTALDGWLVGWLLVSGLSAALAINPWLAWRAWSLTASGIAIYWIARHAAADGRTEAVTWGVAAAVVIAALTGVLQAYGLDAGLMSPQRAPGGTFGNRNFLAHMLAIGLPILMLRTLRAGRAGFWSGLAGIAIVTNAIVLSRSRGAWLALAASGVAAIIAGAIAARSGHRPPRGRRLAMSAIAAGIAALLAVWLPNVLAWRSPSPYRDSLLTVAAYHQGSGRGRLIQYRNTLRMAVDRPLLGVGPGNWFVHYPLVTGPGDPSFHGSSLVPTNPWPSSDWIAALAERGLAGLVCLAGALAVIVRRLWRALSGREPGDAASAAAMTGMLAALAAAAAFDVVLHLAPPLFVACATTGALLPGATPPRIGATRRATRTALLAAGILVTALATAASVRQWVGIVIAGDGTRLASLRRASTIDPGNARLHLLLARRAPCDEARVHAGAALRMLPHHPSARRAAARCAS